MKTIINYLKEEKVQPAEAVSVNNQLLYNLLFAGKITLEEYLAATN